MIKRTDSRKARERRHRRIRARITGTPERPRLVVFRSLKHMYAQVINDRAGHTLAMASTVEPTLRAQATGTKSDRARLVGAEIARRARAAGVERVVFDRGGYLYHGRVKVLADAAREAGLVF